MSDIRAGEVLLGFLLIIAALMVAIPLNVVHVWQGQYGAMAFVTFGGLCASGAGLSLLMNRNHQEKNRA